MNIKKIITETLDNFINEVKKTSYKYCCLMLQYKVTKTWWDSLQDLIDEKDIVRVDGAYGREKWRDAHVTIMYGLHADADIEDIKECVLDIPVRDIRIEKVSIFEGSTYDVVKLDVDYEFLKKMNRSLRILPNTKTFNTYKPHMTLAYVKKGKGKLYAQTLSTKLKKTLKPNNFKYTNKKGEKTYFDIKEKI